MQTTKVRNFSVSSLKAHSNSFDLSMANPSVLQALKEAITTERINIENPPKTQTSGSKDKLFKKKVENASVSTHLDTQPSIC